jgi:hypothetical protein
VIFFWKTLLQQRIPPLPQIIKQLRMLRLEVGFLMLILGEIEEKLLTL